MVRRPCRQPSTVHHPQSCPQSCPQSVFHRPCIHSHAHSLVHSPPSTVHASAPFASCQHSADRAWPHPVRHSRTSDLELYIVGHELCLRRLCHGNIGGAPSTSMDECAIHCTGRKRRGDTLQDNERANIGARLEWFQCCICHRWCNQRCCVFCMDDACPYNSRRSNL